MVFLTKATYKQLNLKDNFSLVSWFTCATILSLYTIVYIHVLHSLKISLNKLFKISVTLSAFNLFKVESENTRRLIDL